ncbi:hypothetical protein [Glaciimonas sp. PCH181]|uniref:hypothetical protein n=1 Tax=Glaciimonas sp. PCH181 TaxID=2133943 RepID=UPI000D3C4240|nr:hypothetical protein [Glaciimonas sp. PCH181]PUA19592.1 hypothetical protein C7W93_07030 [Glaciimonas sp. PCH181]
MDFTVSITDARKLAGITAARNAYNAANAMVDGFIPLGTDQEYVQFVMDGASESYADQYKV